MLMSSCDLQNVDSDVVFNLMYASFHGIYKILVRPVCLSPKRNIISIVTVVVLIRPLCAHIVCRE